MKQNKVFSRIFLWWKASPEFKNELSYKKSGQSIAVLKTILVIALFSDYDSRESVVSLSKLEEITGLSRPMVSKSIQWLEQKGWINIHKRKGLCNSYYLVDFSNKYEQKGWTKIPYVQVHNYLRLLPNKGKKGLTAIKNYILILFQRDKRVDFSKISHKKLVKFGNCLESLIKGGNDLLLSANLISYARYVNTDGNLITSYNLYHIKGLYFGKRGQTQQYADHIEYIHFDSESQENKFKRIYSANGKELK